LTPLHKTVGSKLSYTSMHFETRVLKYDDISDYYPQQHRYLSITVSHNGAVLLSLP